METRGEERCKWKGKERRGGRQISTHKATCERQINVKGKQGNNLESPLCYFHRKKRLLRWDSNQLSHRGSPAGWVQITQVMQGKASN